MRKEVPVYTYGLTSTANELASCVYLLTVYSRVGPWFWMFSNIVSGFRILLSSKPILTLVRDRPSRYLK